MSYQKQQWENLPNQTTPITAERLNHMEDGIEEAWEHGGGAGDTLNIGAIIPFSGSTAPNGYMICDGTAISRTTYAELFSVIGTTFGDGDGSTTFNIPNLKGKVPVGLDGEDEDFDTLGETGGEKEHTLIINEIPAHNHQLKDKAIKEGTGTTTYFDSSTGSFSSSYSNSTGGSQAHNNLQPYITINYIIKVTEAQTGEVLSESLPVGSEIDFDGETVPTGWEQISDTAQILWTNPSPNDGMSSGTTATLNSSDYDILEIFYKAGTGSSEKMESKRIIKGNSTFLSLTYVSSNFYHRNRTMTYISDTEYEFGNGQQIQTNGSTIDNNSAYLIPLYIIGYKTGLFNQGGNS